MGSFKAGESISGLRSLQCNNVGLEYDFVVEQYGVVEFFPQEPTTNTAQYKLQDFEKIASGGYFYVGSAEGITSRKSLDYPDGWKIALMPGTYKIIVYTSCDIDSSDTTFKMNTSFTASTNQSQATGTNFNKRQSDGSYANETKAISVNTLYYDNLFYHRANSEKVGDSTSYSFVNEVDIFSFTLSEKSTITRVVTLDKDTSLNSLYSHIRKSDGTNACSTFYTSSKGESRSDVCTLDSGNYFLEFSGLSSYHEYNFKLLSTPIKPSTPTCSGFSLERDQQQIAMKVGDEDYFNIKVCDNVQIISSDESIATASRYNDGNVDELALKAISDGKATMTLSDSQSKGYLYVTVGSGVVAPITTPDTKQVIGNITFLEYEPDGYFGWSDADKFCKERGYRLPSIKELNYVWNISDKTPSPVGFEKDTFYWASESIDDGASHKACAMDVECSSDEGAWPSVGGNGHPKCVVSVNGSLEIDTGDTPSSVLGYHVNETQDDRKEVDINLGDRRVDVSLPKETTVTQEDDKSIHMQTNPDSDGNSVETVLKENGTLEQVTKKLIDNLVYRTTIIIDYIVESNRVEEDGSSLVKMLIKTLNLEIKTEATAEMSASYSLNGKNIQLPIFSAGSQMHVKSSGEDVLIEVQTKLTTTLRF